MTKHALKTLFTQSHLKCLELFQTTKLNIKVDLKLWQSLQTHQYFWPQYPILSNNPKEEKQKGFNLEVDEETTDWSLVAVTSLQPDAVVVHGCLQPKLTAAQVEGRAYNSGT